MHSRLLVSGLPRSLPSLPPSPAPPCLPCVEGRQRAAPHSSSFPLTTTPLQTLHMDVWGPARVNGQGRERYFLLRFRQDLPVLRLHSDRGGEFSSDLLRFSWGGHPPVDITFDESVPFYHLFPYRTAPLPPMPLFLAPGPPPVDPLPLAEPLEVTIDSSAPGGGAARGALSGGAEPAGAEPGGAEPESAEPGGY
ncbi:unnamed protein product [Closterium sp. NIES-54]